MMTAFSIFFTLVGLATPIQDGSQAPKIQVQNPGVQTGNLRTIPDIREYRGGVETVPYIRRLEDVRELDLSQVDFEAPVVARINGHDVTQAEYRLWLAFAGGQNGVLRAQLIALTREAAERVAAETGDPSAFEVSKEEIDARIRAEEDMARAQGEEFLKNYYARIEDTLGMDRYREFVGAHILSEKLLLPPIKPLEEAGDELQALPVEAAELLDDQPEMREYLNNQYMNGQDFPAMFRTQFLRMLQEKMIARADIHYAIEERYKARYAEVTGEQVKIESIPDGVYMTVNGNAVPLDDILAFVPMGREVKEYALRLLLLYRAIDDELAARDALMSPDDFELIFEAHEAEYEGTLFPLRNLITLRGFLNMPEYREYYRRRAAYRRMIESQKTPDELDAELMAHHQKFGRLFYESGKLNVEIVFSALSKAAEELGETGGASLAAWQKAREKIEAAYAEIKGGASFAEVREKMGDTLPTEPSGVLNGAMRNEIRSKLGENEYSIFVAGYSLADDLFYNRVVGETVGPVRISRALIPGTKGGLGYFIAQPTLFQTMTPIKPFEQQKPLVVSDYFDLTFIYFGHECLKKAEIELAPGR